MQTLRGHRIKLEAVSSCAEEINQVTHAWHKMGRIQPHSIDELLHVNMGNRATDHELPPDASPLLVSQPSRKVYAFPKPCFRWACARVAWWTTVMLVCGTGQASFDCRLDSIALAQLWQESHEGPPQQRCSRPQLLPPGRPERQLRELGNVIKGNAVVPPDIAQA